MNLFVLSLIGLSAGGVVACGLCALLSSVNIITRLASRTETQNRVRIYERAVLFGATLSYFIFIIQPKFNFGKVDSMIILGIIGIFFGIFVGSLAISLAESLDAFSVMFRRIKIKENIKYIILALALGKLIGNIIYFTIG